MRALTLMVLMLAVDERPCTSLWSNVWKAFSARELKGEPPSLFKKLPDAKERLGVAWVGQCKAFDAATLDCVRGHKLEKELAALRVELEADGKSPKKEIDEVMAKLRAEWSPLECKGVEESLDRAAALVARDAGL